MKKLLTFMIALGFLGFSATTQAELFQPEALVKVKPGTCTLMVFQPDGLNPMPAEDIMILDAETAMIVHHGLTDEKGLFVVELDTGRYILAASGVKMAIVDVSENHDLRALRLILPEQSLQVGGAEGEGVGTGKDEGDVPEEDKSDRKGAYWTTGAGAATAAGATATAVGGSLIIEHQNDDGSSPPPEVPEMVTPVTPKKPPPMIEPEEPPGPSEPIVEIDPCSFRREFFEQNCLFF